MTAPGLLVTRLMRDTRDDFEIREDVPFGDSRYVVATADMTVYRAMVTRLPEGVAPSLGADRLVSLIGPVTSCYPFQSTGYLHIDYVTARNCAPVRTT